ncbi:hypothetical protein BYT27DRAFT_6895775 [Phlegmacium glaucopus]|nr:hypothetical protein BYT27DRAFT_6895775 [Phlegmacium glaucopus]
MWTVTLSHQGLMDVYYFRLGLSQPPLNFLCFVVYVLFECRERFLISLALRRYLMTVGNSTVHRKQKYLVRISDVRYCNVRNSYAATSTQNTQDASLLFDTVGLGASEHFRNTGLKLPFLDLIAHRPALFKHLLCSSHGEQPAASM